MSENEKRECRWCDGTGVHKDIDPHDVDEFYRDNEPDPPTPESKLTAAIAKVKEMIERRIGLLDNLAFPWKPGEKDFYKSWVEDMQELLRILEGK